jgi:hypothetical protein
VVERTTSLGGTSPDVFLQKVVRSDIGYMTAKPQNEEKPDGGGGDEMSKEGGNH